MISYLEDILKYNSIFSAENISNSLPKSENEICKMLCCGLYSYRYVLHMKLQSKTGKTSITIQK